MPDACLNPPAGGRIARGMILARPAGPRPAPRAIARWLLAVALVVLLMVVVGGITRLTESGLSMTRWEPVSGTIPPLDEAQWAAEFDAYKATPEYRQVNRGMALAEFKHIYFWEYLHRLIGRSIGLIFAVPLLVFWWRRAIPAGYGPRLAALLALGGLQGAIGWWMVASGLVDRPSVSHFLLATHLISALFIFSGLIWTALDLRSIGRPARLGAATAAAIGVLAIQILFGAFTAGLDAGLLFNQWPLMGTGLFPTGGWNAALGLIGNVASNPIVVQFIHRWFAWIAAGAVLDLAWRARAVAPRAAVAMAGLVALQIGLGIATLLSRVAIPLGVAHQLVATLLLGATICAAHALGRRTA